MLAASSARCADDVLCLPLPSTGGLVVYQREGTGSDLFATPAQVPFVNPSRFTSVCSHNAFEETVQRIAGAINARLLSPGDQRPPERELAQ